MVALTAATCTISSRNSSYHYLESDSVEIDIGNSSSDDKCITMNAPSSRDQNNDANITNNNARIGRPRDTPLLSQSMMLPTKVSLIDNTLAQGYSLKRARAGTMKKSNSDGMIGAKRMKLPSYCPTTVVISSTNFSSRSLSNSSFGKVDPEENLCPYSFIESLKNSDFSSGSGSSSQDDTSLPSRPRLSKQNSEPLTDDDFFPPTPEQIEAYSNDALSAVRSSDVNSLRQLHSAGHSLECCNRFGESLLHVACRRSNAEIVSFLLNEANVSPRIRDDYGRTPLHDACWRGNPEYEIVELLLSVEPRLVFVKDVRGYKPFQYARREHWSCWRKFIDQKRELIL